VDFPDVLRQHRLRRRLSQLDVALRADTTQRHVGFVDSACTLPVPERPLRGAEFSSLFATALQSLERIDRRHLRLLLTGGSRLLARIAELTARESECCSFFEFAVTQAGDAVQVDVVVPDAHADVLDGLARQAAAAAGLAA
jgi:hypothetical protein